MTETLKIVTNLSGDGGKTHVLSLADPKEGLTYAEVSAVVTKIIDDDLLDIDGKVVKSLNKVYIHKVDDVELTAT